MKLNLKVKNRKLKSFQKKNEKKTPKKKRRKKTIRLIFNLFNQFFFFLFLLWLVFFLFPIKIFFNIYIIEKNDFKTLFTNNYKHCIFLFFNLIFFFVKIKADPHMNVRKNSAFKRKNKNLNEKFFLCCCKIDKKM